MIGTRSRRRAVRFGALPLIVLLVGLAPGRGTAPGEAAGGWRFYKVDTHVHSSVSADATSDLGIHALAAVRAGYDALFVTDHDGGSAFAISGQNALTTRCCAPLPRPDPWPRWDLAQLQDTPQLNDRIEDGPFAGALRLMKQGAVGGYAETGRYVRRGPNLRSGRITIRFDVYPVRVDLGSGVYVSASIGGDPYVDRTPDGYTTAAGVISPGKSTVMVWQLGSARVPSADPNARVLTYSLGAPALNSWTTYTIDVTRAIADIPAADLPLDYNGLIHPKMAVAAVDGGTAEAYFANLSISAAAPETEAAEFVNRTRFVGAFDTGTFRIFPSYEMGRQKHTNRFDFGITEVSQYRTYQFGADGIAETQQGGYPAQANHPGSTITVQEVVNTAANGADFLEVRHQPWVDAWDQVLLQGKQILGVWSSDTHNGVDFGTQAAYIYAPALDFDLLIRSLYEGRFYNALANFPGRVILTPDAASAEPYPARYPVYVPDSQTTADVRFSIDAGLSSGMTVVLVRNGVPVRTDTPIGPGYDLTYPVELSGPSTYVRAEVRSAGGAFRAMTQPIFFVKVSGLPAGRSVRVERVVTADGRGYARPKTKGITSSAWDTRSQAMSLTLENPPGALVTGRVTAPAAPARVTIDGVAAPALGPAGAVESAAESAWFFDAAAQRLHWKAKHTAATATVLVEFLPPSTTFLPAADAYVDASAPNAGTNYGSRTALRVDGSPELRAYVRFDVQGLTAPVGRARLRLVPNSSHGSGFQVRRALSGVWEELAITAANQPGAAATVAGRSGALVVGIPVEIDVTSSVAGNGPVSFVLTTGTAAALSLVSREGAAASAPQLIVETR